MVHEVLEADVQFARVLMQSNRADSEIISALCRRGVEAVKASQLVNDLRHHLPVKGLAVLSAPTGNPQRPGPALANETSSAVEPEPEVRRPRHRQKPTSVWGLIIVVVVLVFIWALGYCLLHDENNPADIEKHDLPTPPSSKDFDEKR